MSYDIIKASELYRSYSCNVFNRIIKLKICPIDNKRFCYENVSSSIDADGKAIYTNSRKEQ